MTTIEQLQAAADKLNEAGLPGSAFIVECAASELAALQKEVEVANLTIETTGRVVLARDSTIDSLRTQNRELREAFEKIYGFGRSTSGHADLTFDEFANLVNETCKDALALSEVEK